MAVSATARLIASLELNADKFARGVKVANASIDSLSKKTGKIGGIASRGLGQAGHNIGRGVEIGALAAGGALVYATHKAVEWESAVAGVNKTIEATPQELEGIAQGIRDMSTTMPTAATDLAAIAETAGALGIAKGDILAFTKQVAILGATTNVSTDDAATALGQLQNVIGLTGDEFDNFAASLVDLGNKGASTEAQILEVASRSGASAHLIGLAKDATLGWASAAANLGLRSELAGTALQSFYLKSSQNIGRLAKVAGTSTDEFAKLFKKDASGALELFLAKLGKMPKDARLREVQQIFGKGSGLTRLVLGLSDSVENNLTPSLNTAEEAWRDSTAATAEFEKRQQTTAAQLDILRNNIDDAAVTIGTNLLPILNELAKEGVAWITDHQKEIKDFGTDLAAGIRDFVGWVKQLDFKAIEGGLRSAAGFAKTLIDAFTSMPAEVQGTILALAGLNKLSGGAVSDIVGELGKGLIKGVLGMTAGVVNITAGVVNGGGGVPGAGAMPGATPTPAAAPASVLSSVAKLILPITAGIVANEFLNGIGATWSQSLAGNNPKLAADLNTSFKAGLGVAMGPFQTLTQLPDTIAKLSSAIDGLGEAKPGAIPPEGRGVGRDAQGNLAAAIGDSFDRAVVPPVNAVTAAVTSEGASSRGTAVSEGAATRNTIGSTSTATQAAVAAGALNTVSAVDANRAAVAAEVAGTRGTLARTTMSTTSAATTAGYRAATATYSIGNRIVSAIFAAKPVINVTTVNRTSTINNQYGPSGGSANTHRTGQD